MLVTFLCLAILRSLIDTWFHEAIRGGWLRRGGEDKILDLPLVRAILLTVIMAMAVVEHMMIILLFSIETWSEAVDMLSIFDAWDQCAALAAFFASRKGIE